MPVRVLVRAPVAGQVLAREGTFDAEVVNFEFRRQCLQAWTLKIF